MDESRYLPDDELDAARCPIPDWALRPLILLLPLLAIAAAVWFFLR